VQPLRVALLSYRSEPHCGGQGVYVRRLSRELAALGHRVEVFSGPPYPQLDAGVGLTEVPSLDLYRQPDPFRVPHPREFHSGVDVLEFAMMCTAAFPEPLTFSLRAARALRHRLADFDVVHDNQCLGYGMLRIAHDLPMVATIHHPITVDRRLDLAAAPLRRQVPVRRWYGFLRMQKRVARRMEHVITVSDNSRHDLVRDFGLRPQDLRVIPVGVDGEVFRPHEAPRVEGRIVAMASADVPLKGVRTLLEAVAKLRTERDVHVVIVGRPKPGGPTEKLLDDLDLHDAVRFVKGISDAELAALLASAQVACVPSLYEGFSFPAIEALACATPLVATRAGALPEVVGPDGECALLVDPGDAGQLAGAIARLLDDPPLRDRLGAAGRRRVLDRYSWRAIADATAQCYADAIARRAAAC
jgi:glycosyltransferase involved in cell wall biosynthesis